MNNQDLELHLEKENLNLTKITFLELELKYFIPIFLIILIAMFMDVLPKGMIGAFAIMMTFGAVLDYIGNKTPIVKDYLGGGPIVVIFASAALVYYNVFSKDIFSIVTNFMKGGGFLDFYIAALIVGSILGMNRTLLIKASLKYLPVLVSGVFLSLMLTGLVGALLGYGFIKSIFYIAIPIMGGGMGAGAVPLSQIFGQALNQNPTDLLSVMVPAVALGNAIAIVVGAFLNKIGKKYPFFSGEGKLLKNLESDSIEKESKKKGIELKELGCGMIIALSFFIFGKILAKFIPMHAYALMIISVAIAKALNLIDKKYEECAAKWYQFIATNFTSALLVGIGIAYTSLAQVIDAFTFTYLILVLTTIIGAVVGTAIAGHFLGFYMIEASITAGLCMANMGGTGDVAVLSGANRMELMPFAQISSRIGGAFMLILTSLLANLL